MTNLRPMTLLRLCWRYPLGAKLPFLGGPGFFLLALLTSIALGPWVDTPLAAQAPALLVLACVAITRAREGADLLADFCAQGPFGRCFNVVAAFFLFPAFWLFPALVDAAQRCLALAHRSRESSGAPSIARQAGWLALGFASCVCVALAVGAPAFLAIIGPAFLAVGMAAGVPLDPLAVLATSVAAAFVLSFFLALGVFSRLSERFFASRLDLRAEVQAALRAAREALMALRAKASGSLGAMSNLARRAELALVEEGERTGALARSEAIELSRSALGSELSEPARRL